MFLPTTKAILLVASLIVSALLAALWPALIPLWTLHCGIVAGVLLVDLLRLTRLAPISVKREVASYLSLDVPTHISLTLQHTKPSRRQSLTVYDHHPESFQVKGQPQRCELPAKQQAVVTYKATPKERGKFDFTQLQLKSKSVMGFWQRSRLIECDSVTHVYPNFSAVSNLALLAMENKLSQVGIVKKQRRGQGQDFHQLREYREGDSIRQIDWKATSRMQKLIAREYQDERDQEIVFLLDCGHRMRTQDSDLSHFDHTLNAILLLSHIALKQGDAVGLSTFAGTDKQLKPKKGNQAIQQILNTVYDIQPSHQAPDYTQAVTQLLSRQKKRALVILLTNIRAEDTPDLLPAMSLLRKHHLTLIANCREQALDDALDEPIDTLDDALTRAATHHYLGQRKTTFDQLSNSKIHVLDTIPQGLSVNLINTYLAMKRSGTF